ncbi:MAG: KH domain-containing protein [Deltaproteobacteria bacterium]
MKDLLEVIAKALVDSPEQVEVTERKSDDAIRLELKVAPDEVGKVIGKQGKIAKAIRTLVKANAVKENKKVYVDINQ